MAELDQVLGAVLPYLFTTYEEITMLTLLGIVAVLFVLRVIYVVITS